MLIQTSKRSTLVYNRRVGLKITRYVSEPHKEEENYEEEEENVWGK